MKKVLICYYSETNSTEEVCQDLQNTMTMNYNVDLSRIEDISSIESYDTVIVAAPVHGLRWHETAYNFVVNFANNLMSKEVIYIALSALAYQSRPFWQKKVYKVLERPSKIVLPLETAIFGGIMQEVPPFLSFVFGIPKNAKRDQRDWNTINEWKKKLLKKI